jgi:hypothetical protein
MSLVTPPTSRLSRRAGAIIGSAVLIAAVAVPGFALASVRPAATTGTIHGCANKKTGALRVATSCSSAERAVVWSIQGPRGATGATGKAGANGATGPVGPAGVAGDPGANGATGPQGSPGPSGSPGPAGSPGPSGPSGPSGVVGLRVVNGDATDIPVGSTWGFVGPSTSITLGANQTVSGAVSASLGVAAGNSVTIDVDFCYATQNDPTPQPFYGYTYVRVDLTGPRQLVSDTATMSPLDSNGGTYKVGLCVKYDSGTVPVDQNDYVTGWLLVANGQIITG